jgi:hypothetical protein
MMRPAHTGKPTHAKLFAFEPSGLTAYVCKMKIQTSYLAACVAVVSFSCGPTMMSSDGGIDSGIPGDCSAGEPNDTRETSTVIDVAQTRVGCVGGADDKIDFYEFTAPALGAAGGLLEVVLSEVSATSGPEITIYAVADNGEILNRYEADKGKSLNAWTSIASGAKYRIAINAFANSGRFNYKLGFKATAINDTFEPNNTRLTAKPIALGTAIQASVGAVSPNATFTTSDVQDWFKVTLAAGAATILMSNVPADYAGELTVYDASGTQIKNEYNTTKGANVTLALPANNPAGEVTISVESFASKVRYADDGVASPSYTSQYSLKVSQP